MESTEAIKPTTSTSTSPVVPAPAPAPYKREIVWTRLFLLVALHVLALGGLYVRWNRLYLFPTYVFTKICAFLSILGITVGAHKLWSHRAFKPTFLCEAILMSWACLTYQNSVYTWVRDHRLHHKCAETNADPHNATRGFFFSHIGWLMIKKHPDIKERGKEVDMSDLQANPIVMFQHKYYNIIMFITMLVFPLFVPVYFWNETIQVAFVSLVYRYILSINMIWTINSVAHKFGTRPVDSEVSGVQANVISPLMMGEEGHNFHHVYPYDYRSSEFTDFDFRNVGTIVIETFEKLGMAKDLRSVPRDVVQRRKERTGDGSTADQPSVMKTALFLLFMYLF